MVKAGQVYSILYLFLFTYFIQYIFSTYLIYNEYEELERFMPIGQEIYFSYTVPALIFLFLGVFLFNTDVKIVEILGRIKQREASSLGFLLLGISYLFDALNRVGVSGLDSFLSFTVYLKYVAAFCFLFINSKWKYVLIAFVYVQLFLTALRGGVFIDFFIWCTYLFFFLSLKFKFPLLLRCSFIIVALPVLVVIQSVKTEYRDVTWQGRRSAGVDLFAELIEKKNMENTDEPFTRSKGFVSTIGRLSEGWHLSLTLKHVPHAEPYAEGQEMLSDIVSSIVPRVLVSDKKVVGSQAKFHKYTGRKLRGSTSMTIGVLGDFYVNFGWWGSFIMLFVFGALIALALNYFLKTFVVVDPINLVWVPFILSYLIRANNDFYIVFNCMTKGFVIFLFVNFIRKRYLS